MPSDLVTIPGDLAPMIIPIIHPGNGDDDGDDVFDDHDDDGDGVRDDHDDDENGGSKLDEDLVLMDAHIKHPAAAGG